MKRKTKILLILSLIILISISCFGFVALKSRGENHQEANLNEGENSPKVALLNDEQKTQSENNTNVNSNVIETKQHEELINISECSEEFMEEYFEEVKEIEDKENVLIVSSKEKIENTYGATKIIEAPNNQYILQYESAEKKDKALSGLKEDTSISTVEENIIYTIEDVDYNSWGVEKMALDHAINSSRLEILSNVTVAIIDTGCDLNLFNKYYGGKILETYNVLENSTTSMVDEDGHGTHIAGTIAESTTSNVKILPVKVSRDGNMYSTDIVTAINYITYNNKADVINMSFGAYYYSDMIDQAIKAANEKNIICVAAAGNDNTDKKHYPSSLNNTISIASVDSELKKSSFSNYGSDITFAAPGTAIQSINGVMSGTSMATPHAASAIAILKSYNKDLTLENTIEVLKMTAVDLGDKGWDEKFGHGLISFNDVQFRQDDVNTDEYKVYKDINRNITNIELAELKFTPYNYYSLTNIMASKIKVYYADNTNKEMSLWELPDLEVLNYNPTEENQQKVTIKTGNISIDVDAINPSNYESGWEYDYLNQTEIKITAYKSHGLNIGRLDIPEKIDSKNVSAFEDNLEFSKLGNDFSHYEYLYLPSNFKRIGDYTLSNTGIKYVYGDSSEVEIGNHAFEASSIVIVDVPITKVGDYAFKNCFELVRIDIAGEFAYTFGGNHAKSKTSIGDYAFYDCKKLAQVKQSKNYDILFTEKIGKYAFYNCISLSQLEMEPNRDIGEYAFYNCFSLITLDLYQVDSIGIYSFYGSGISEANLGLVEEVKESAFENCRNLKAISCTSGRIESRAFWNSGVEEVSIGSQVEYISEDAFAYCPINDSDGNMQGENYTCDSDVGIIENATNKLIVGFKGRLVSGNTEIPSSVIQIGNYAFTGNNTIKTVIIPESVTEIGAYAFKDCYQLASVYMLGNSIRFGNDTFVRTHEGEIENSELFIYVHKDHSNIRQYINSKNLKYRNIEPDEIIVIDNKEVYRAFDKVDEDSLVVKLIYHEENNREEILPKMDRSIRTVLTNTFGVGFQRSSGTINYGDTYYTLHIRNIHGYEEQQKKVEIEVLKAIPKYEIPTNLKATEGQTLSQIELPEGFSWMDETEIINGNNTIYKAKYTPKDTDNYEIVENIDINVYVKRVAGFSIPTPRKEYKAFETVDTTGWEIDINYFDGSYETVTKGITIKYTGENTSFRYGDTSYTVCWYNEAGLYMEKEIEVTVTKVTPEYTIPTNIEAIPGQTLSQIELPKGFEWMDETQIIEGFGDVKYKAKYIPEDTTNYETIENIEITINVKNNIDNKYVGNINSELITFNVAKNHEGATYVSGQIVVVEWVNGVSTVPKVAPKMSFKSVDGIVNMEVFVTPTGTNTYYFDRFIEGIDTSKEYFFEIESGNENNVSPYKKMNVYFTQTKYNDTVVGNYYKKQIRLLKQKIIFEDRTDTYVGNINSELITFNVAMNHEGATYVSGQIVVVEWVNGLSTVPKVAPKMRFKSEDGTVNMEVFVTPTGTNTYYFDRFIEGINTSKEYFFEIESGDERNVSENRSMNVYFTQTKYNDTIVGQYKNKNIRLLKQRIIFEDVTDTYVGNINSELITFNVAENYEGATYVSGQIVVVEWVNGLSTVPKVAPKMKFKSTDGTVELEVFVTPTGTNTYYFDRFIEGIDTSKQYFFEIESGDEKNVSEYRSMNVYFTQTKYNDTIVGKYNNYDIRLLKQNIIFE